MQYWTTCQPCMYVLLYVQIKQANFFGDSWVMSGSDCGRVFVWDKWSGEVVNMFTADSHVVNCVQPHPSAHSTYTHYTYTHAILTTVQHMLLHMLLGVLSACSQLYFLLSVSLCWFLYNLVPMQALPHLLSIFTVVDSMPCVK